MECHPGVHEEDVRSELTHRLASARTLDSCAAFKSLAEVDALVAPFLGRDDPVFGYLNQTLNIMDFLDASKSADFKRDLSTLTGLVLVVGPGASLLAPQADLLVYADMPRWEGQLRQRQGMVDNLGAPNLGLKASLQYKRNLFIDWRVADRLKQATMAKWDFLLDTTTPVMPSQLLLPDPSEHPVFRPR